MPQGSSFDRKLCDRARQAPSHRRAGVAFWRAAVAVGLVAGLTACGSDGLDVRALAGFDERGPDEFTVVKKRPLQMPSDMSALPTPRPGAPSLVDPTPTETAASVLTGGNASNATATAATASAGESSFLAAAGASQADPEIRQALEAEGADREVRLLDGLLGSDEPDTAPLDADAEVDRLVEEARRKRGETGATQ